MYRTGFCKYFTKFFVYFLKNKKRGAEASHFYVIFRLCLAAAHTSALRSPCKAPCNGP